jgi:hypothetical protein
VAKALQLPYWYVGGVVLTLWPALMALLVVRIAAEF